MDQFRSVRYVKAGVSVVTWACVLLAATHQSHTPVVFGRYSWGYSALLGVLAVVALMLSRAKYAWYLKLYQARVGLAMSCLSLLLCLGALELGIRLIDPLGISYYEAIGNYMRDKQLDKQLVFRHKPSWETRYGNVLVTYNEQGLRDRPIEPKAQGEYRVLALGDSVTFGWGVPQDQIFPVRLEEILQERLHRPVRVINSGVAGYNTVQELTYFKQEGLALQPDLVVLTYVQNDINELPASFPPKPLPAHRAHSVADQLTSLLGKLWIYRLANHAYHYAWPTSLKKPSAAPSPESAGWRQSMAALEELVALCKQRDLPLVVFFERSQQSESTRLLEDVVQHARGVPVQDMAPWYDGQEVRAFLNSTIDSHPNAAGHRLIADHMAEDVVSYLALTAPDTLMAGQGARKLGSVPNSRGAPHGLDDRGSTRHVLTPGAKEHINHGNSLHVRK